jgi:molybdopterin/thiamine biosynthesis adenylyltransferase
MPNNELYTRQIPLQLSIVTHLTVVGCGGIGSWVAILAAMSGVQTIYLFDPDIMEESNRNRLPFCQGSIGRPKVDVVREYIQAIRPDAIVVGIQEKLEGELLALQLRVCSYFIECTDSPKSQHKLYSMCKEKGALFIRAGYDGTHITVTGSVSGWIKTDVETENYTVQPSWVVPAVTVAALAVGKLFKYMKQEVSLDLNEIGIPALEKKSSVTSSCSKVVGRER